MITSLSAYDSEGRIEHLAHDLDVSARTARVLIVDDHDVSRRICAATCELFHLASASVASGAEALLALQRDAFDVVLMDINMPGMNGVETTRAIRALPGALGRIPIIAVTSAAEPEQIEAYLSEGMADVAPKPITPARLFKAISLALQRPYEEPRSWVAA